MVGRCIALPLLYGSSDRVGLLLVNDHELLLFLFILSLKSPR